MPNYIETPAQSQEMQPKKTLMGTMAARFGMDAMALQATLKSTIFPSGKEATQEQVAAFMIVANQYELNPFTREIYAFPNKSGGIQPIVGIDGWARIVTRHPDFDGVEFEEERNSGVLISATCKMYRKSCSHPVSVTEYMDECKRNTEPWQKWPSRMLRHKAYCQAARIAFGVTGIIDEDEAERYREINAVVLEDKKEYQSSTQEVKERMKRGRKPKVAEEKTVDVESSVEEAKPDRQPGDDDPDAPPPFVPQTATPNKKMCADYDELLTALNTPLRKKAMERAVYEVTGKQTIDDVDGTDAKVCEECVVLYRKYLASAMGRE